MWKRNEGDWIRRMRPDSTNLKTKWEKSCKKWASNPNLASKLATKNQMLAFFRKISLENYIKFLTNTCTWAIWSSNSNKKIAVWLLLKATTMQPTQKLFTRKKVGYRRLLAKLKTSSLTTSESLSVSLKPHKQRSIRTWTTKLRRYRCKVKLLNKWQR